MAINEIEFKFEDFSPGLITLCEGENPTVDVIAVHGLGANPDYTWKYRIKTKKGGKEYVQWLSDPELLPSQIPNARIMAFNYPSRWHRNAPHQRRPSCAIQLLQAVHSDRQKNPQDRPIVFIGHSFGGIVIEQAIMEARKEPSWDYVTQATAGIIFLGTPHRGTKAAIWGEVFATVGAKLGVGSYNGILKDLQEDSEALGDMLESFTRWLFLEWVPVVCFYELYVTNYAKRLGIPGLHLTVNQMVVPKDSAIIHGHKNIALNTDHIAINKYSGPDDASYKAVFVEIKDMVAEGPIRVKARSKPRAIPQDDRLVKDMGNQKCLQSLHWGLEKPSLMLGSIRRTKGKRIPGTCEWILFNPKYTEWAATEGSQLLCVVGTAGIGKTMIASYLVDQIETRAKRSPSTLFLYFFCDNKDETRRTSKAVLRGLLVQLLQQQPSFFKHVQGEYDKMGDQLRDNFDSLRDIFLAILRDPEASSTFILIDALDECENDSKQEIAETFRESFEEAAEKQSIKVLITHRPEEVGDWPLTDTGLQLRIDMGTINTDLQKYIEVKVEEFLTKIKRFNLKPSTEKNIREKLTGQAGGTFLWISLVLDYISKSRSLSQLEDRLSQLPPNLEAVYERILQTIDSDCQKKAAFILHIVFIARRPLKVQDLATTFLLGPGNYNQSTVPTEGDVNERESEYKLCGAFLQLDEETRVINLVHQSAKDFLRDSLAPNRPLHERYTHYYPEPGKTNLLMLQICWRYLSMKEFLAGDMIVERRSDRRLRRRDMRKSLFERYYFLKYASQEWEEHAIAVYPAWLDQSGIERGTLDELPALRDLWLLRAAKEGQDIAVGQLLDRGAVIGSEGSDGRTPLSLAAANGHERVVKLLLGKEGVDPDSRNLNGRTPLLRAAGNGHEGVVKLLLGKEGVDPDSKDFYGRTPLSRAAADGHERVVKLLLGKEGVNPDSKDSYGRTPLSLAAGIGHEGVVKLLLGKEGVNPNSKDSDGRTPLWRAAGRGHERVVDILLSKESVNPDSKDSYGQTPLSWAAGNGHEGVVKLLLGKEGVDPDFKDSDSRTPLLWAAGNGHEGVVKLLLGKEGVDPDSKDSDGWTPLLWAAANGHKGMVKLLLDKEGVNPDSKDSYGRTPLWSAAAGRHEGVVKLLLDKEGVNPDSKDSYGRTPLLWAAKGGHEGVVKLLLDKEGVDPDFKDSDGRTPLLWAAANGHEGAVKLLLSKEGVDPGSKDSDGWTPLWLAAERGYDGVVKLLRNA